MLKEAAFSVYHYVSAHPVQAQTGIAIAFIIYYFIVLPIKSPLWRIPGPYIHRVSYIPCLNAQRKGEWIRKVHALHKQFGDVVILSPNEISVNGQSKFITDIYVKNFPKSRFYENFRNHGFKDNIFASLENDRHIKYKRLINNLYNKSAIFSKENHTRSVLLKTAAKLVERVGEESPSIDVFTLFGALAMDVVSRFELGPDNGTHLLDLPNERFIIESHRKVSSMGFWTTLMPNFLWDFAATRATLKAVDDICNFQLNLYKFAEKNVSSNGKNLTTMETLKKNGLTGEHCYSFLTDNLFAGHETTAVSMTYLCYELSRPAHRKMQETLRNELHEAFPDGQIDLETVDNLPYLDALFSENARVHSSIPGAEPRVVDREYVAGNTVIPKNTVISCLPYSLHRTPKVFPNPDKFIPERWLVKNEEDKIRVKKQHQYMMPFGKGVRMCLGMNLAIIEMKLAIANLYWNYSSTIDETWCKILDDDKPIKLGNKCENNTDQEQMKMFDSYTTRPLLDECYLKWEKV
ncbi:FGM1 Cytochrome P450 monooxygenase FGM1 [Candida maltosa Xu316]